MVRSQRSTKSCFLRRTVSLSRKLTKHRLIFFVAESEEISPLPPCGLLIEIYIFYENCSTETFRKKESKKRADSSTYKVWTLIYVKNC
mgnify:CR=1 FL=1